MSSTTARIEEVALGAVVAIAIAVYSYAIYYAPDAPRLEANGESSARNVSVIGILSVLAHPIRIAWPHVHVPFIPIGYLLSFLYAIFYPAVVILQFPLYLIATPIRLAYAFASFVYPFYVFFGVAALVGLAVGSGFAGVAHLVWFIADPKG